MAIIKQYHKDTDTTYVYESISYWDEEKKQSRSKRRVIGKLDPETGEIIPTGRRGRRPKDAPAMPEGEDAELSRLYKEARDRVRELSLAVDQKDIEISSLRNEIRRLKDAMGKIDRQLALCRDICTDQISGS